MLGLLRVHRWRPLDVAAPAALVEGVFADVDLTLCLFDLLYGGDQPTALVSDVGQLHILREHQAFLDSALDKTPPLVGGADCRNGHLLVDAIRQSLESGQALQVKGARYEPV